MKICYFKKVQPTKANQLTINYYYLIAIREYIIYMKKTQLYVKPMH